jgi:hypothetical protein
MEKFKIRDELKFNLSQNNFQKNNSQSFLLKHKRYRDTFNRRFDSLLELPNDIK